MSRNVLIGIGCVFTLGCLVCIGFLAALVGGVLLLTAPVADAGTNFLTEVKEGDFATAYSLCSRSLQEELGSAEDLQVFFSQYAPNITEWSFNSRNIENNTGSLLGNVTLADGSKRDIELYFLKEGDDWKVSSIQIN